MQIVQIIAYAQINVEMSCKGPEKTPTLWLGYFTTPVTI